MHRYSIILFLLTFVRLKQECSDSEIEDANEASAKRPKKLSMKRRDSKGKFLKDSAETPTKVKNNNESDEAKKGVIIAPVAGQKIIDNSCSEQSTSDPEYVSETEDENKKTRRKNKQLRAEYYEKYYKKCEKDPRVRPFEDHNGRTVFDCSKCNLKTRIFSAVKVLDHYSAEHENQKLKRGFFIEFFYFLNLINTHTIKI